MRTELNISIPNPCHENWDNMLPNQKGRHCNSCQKTVVDFTTKTDESIVKYFLEHQNICGRFKDQQLNRPVVLSRKSKNNYWSFIASGLLGFLSLVPQETNAQTPIKTVQNDTIKTPLVKGKIAKSVLNTKTISGVVLDDQGLPLPAATILVKGTANGTSTDFDGNYTLNVKKGDTIVVSYVGYSNKEIKVNNTNNFYNFKLEPDNVLGELVVVGMVNNNNTYYVSPEQKHLDSIAKRNTKIFYKQKFEAFKAARKQKRLDRKAKRKQAKLNKAL